MCIFFWQLKWCAWIAVYCSFISFANSRSSEDTKQMMSSFMWVVFILVTLMDNTRKLYTQNNNFHLKQCVCVEVWLFWTCTVCSVKFKLFSSGYPYLRSWCRICKTHSPCHHRGNKWSKRNGPSQQGNGIRAREKQLILPLSFWKQRDTHSSPQLANHRLKKWPIKLLFDLCFLCALNSRLLLLCVVWPWYGKILIY